MNGHVDPFGRALMSIRLKHPVEDVEIEVEAWIDTAFSGELVLPQPFVTRLNLPAGPAIDAVLADGNATSLPSLSCLIYWFDEWKEIEVIASNAQFPLLGVGLLLDHQLLVDYRARTVTIQ